MVLTVVARSLDVANAAECREQMRPLIEASTGRVVVDCSQFGFIDSSGVGALLHANSLLPESRRPLRLTGVGTKVLTSLEMMQVHRQFDLEPGN